jgi:hypothetical protein
VPELILTDPKVSAFITPPLVSRAKILKEKFPQAIGDYVDWFAVEALGALHDYAQEQKLQVQQHGASPVATELQKQKTSALEKKLAAEKKAKADHAKNWFSVMPGVEFKKVKIKRAA